MRAWTSWIFGSLILGWRLAESKAQTTREGCLLQHLECQKANFVWDLNEYLLVWVCNVGVYSKIYACGELDSIQQHVELDQFSSSHE